MLNIRLSDSDAGVIEAKGDIEVIVAELCLVIDCISFDMMRVAFDTNAERKEFAQSFHKMLGVACRKALERALEPEPRLTKKNVIVGKSKLCADIDSMASVFLGEKETSSDVKLTILKGGRA